MYRRGKINHTLAIVMAMLGHGTVASAAGEPVWTLKQTLVAADGDAHDWFGGAVAIDGDTLVVGAGGKSVGDQPAVGAVYVFTRSSGVWQQQAKLQASNPAHNSGFGNSVAIDGNTLLVGASANGFGYFFERSGNTWAQQGAPLDDMSTAQYKELGSAVAISGDFALFTDVFFGMVGNATPPGAAFLYERNNGVWGATTPYTQPPAALLFGTAVAMSGDTAVITAQQLREVPVSGAGFVFVRNGDTWSAQGTLRDLTFSSPGDFADFVAISGDTVMLSGRRSDAMGNPVAGAAWFLRTGQAWAQQGTTLLVPNTYSYSPRVAMSGDSAALTASASVYLFHRTNDTWTQYGSPIIGEYDDFGVALALSQHDLIIGEGFEGAERQGEAFVYTDGPCASDVDCPANAYCSQTDCLARCTTDTDCPSGSYCENGSACVVLPTQGQAGEGGLPGQLGTAGEPGTTDGGGTAGEPGATGGSMTAGHGGIAGDRGTTGPTAGSGTSGGAPSSAQGGAVGAAGESTPTRSNDQLVTSCGCRLGRKPGSHAYGLLGLVVLGFAVRRKTNRHPQQRLNPS